MNDESKAEAGAGARESAADSVAPLSISPEEINRALPNLKCLRCGSESFFLLGPAVSTHRLIVDEYKLGPIHFYGGQPQTVRLVCQECGMIEEHSVDILKNRIVNSGY